MYAILFLCLHRFWSKRSRSKLTFCNRSAIAFLSPCRHSFFTYSGALSSLRLGCSATIRSILAFAARRKLNCRVAGAGIPGSNGWSSYMVLQLEKIKMGFKGSSQKKNIWKKQTANTSSCSMPVLAQSHSFGDVTLLRFHWPCRFIGLVMFWFGRRLFWSGRWRF